MENDAKPDPNLVNLVARRIKNEYICRYLHRFAILMKCDVAHACEKYFSILEPNQGYDKAPEPRPEQLTRYAQTTLLPLLKEYKELAESGIRLTKDMESGKMVEYEEVLPFVHTLKKRGGDIIIEPIIDKIKSLRISSDTSETNQDLPHIIGDQLRLVKYLCEDKILEFSYYDDGSDTETEEA